MLFTEWIQEVYTSYLTAIYEMADPRTAEWLLVKSPLYPSLILLCYVYFCVNSRTLTARMPTYKLRPVLILYNLFMVILSSYMVVEFFLTAYLLNYTLTCQSMEYDSSALPMRMARVCWLYYFSKYLELFETVMFALRKKYNQITFLHVYHHCSIIFFWWLGMKYLAGGTSYIFGGTNSFVHVVMYTYYGLSAIGPHMQQYLWWKKYLTILQLIQFIWLFVQSGAIVFGGCNFSKLMCAVMIGYAISLLILFLNFYVKSYHAKDQRPKLKEEFIDERKLE